MSSLYPMIAMYPGLAAEVKTEVNILVNAGFIRKVQYTNLTDECGAS